MNRQELVDSSRYIEGLGSLPDGSYVLLDDALDVIGAEVERVVRIAVHTCRRRLLAGPADEEAAVQVALGRIREGGWG